MWSGYFSLGGNEVGNSARALGYTRTSDCPIHWLRDRDCGGLAEALGDEAYTYDRIENAPWYDPDEPELTSRFLGLYVVDIQGLSDSTATGTLTEKNTDGGLVSGYRHRSRDVRVRAILTARGMDALESGMTWLRNVLEPNACGTHGTSCGAADFGFFVSCPPPLGLTEGLGPWTEQRRNLFPNPRGTSTSTDYWGATLGTLSLVTDMPGDTTTGVRWTRTGAGVGEIRLLVGDTLPDEDAPLHVKMVVRASEEVTLGVIARPDVASTTGQSSLTTPIVLSAGVNVVDVNGSMLAEATTTGGIVLTITGGATSATVDVTEVLVEGSPFGDYFDGEFADDDDVEYAWVGDPDESASTLSIQPVVQTPQTPEEYEETINGLRRNLHTVTRISGPLVQQDLRSSDGSHFGYVVEFTLHAGVPFVFGVTKEITVPPLTPTVLQDTPFNLVTYPSAELSSSAPDLVAAVGTAGTKVTIPTHVSPAGGQSAHPSIVDFGSAWNGYRYWMASTPYPDMDDAASDPNITASTDGTTWVVPAGLTNPLDDQPGSPDAYNSDTELVYGPDNMLWLLWRTYDPDTVGGEEQMWLRKSADGVTWDAKVMVHQDDETVRRLTSPTLIWEDDGWTMYAVDVLQNPNRLVRTRMEAETMTIAGWTAPVNCTLPVPSGRDVWTVEIRAVQGRYLGLMSDSVEDEDGTNGDLYVILSDDGLTFTRGSAVAIPRTGGTTPGHQALRRGTFTMIDTRRMGIWYSGWNTGSPTVWNVFRGTLTAPETVAAVVAATNYSPNPSAEVNAANLDAATEVVSGDDPAPYFTSGRVTGELQSVGSASFRGAITGDGATSDTGRSYIWLTQTVPLTGLPTDTRVSFNIWGAVVIVGGASGSTIHGVQATAQWRTGTTVLDTLTIGTASAPEFGGRAYQLDSQLKPDAADNVLVRVRFDVTWTSDTTPSMNSQIQAYIDAIAVTVP